jgi:type I restriction-modification system DNA methylase subunit
MSLDEDFISKVCNAFRKAVESASEVTIEGREREFRRILARYLFDETLGWEGHSKIGEIYDITCFDEENFPIILVETKWGVEPTREIKDKLRKRIEELGSVKYGVFASERDFIVYEYADLKLEEVTKINVAEATGVARGEYGLSEDGKKRILRLELLKRERLVWVEEPEYFERTYKETSITKGEGIKLLINNLKGIVEDLATAFMNFIDSYRKREYHYSSKFLRNTFTDWLKLSMKYEDYEKVDENKKKAIMKVFCRETAYVLLGRILFVRICEDKGILEQSLSGKRLAEYLRFYGKRRTNIYLHAFYDSREEIKNYYSHLHELGYFDWWWISPEKRELLNKNDRREQDRLEKDLDDKICKCLRRLNRFNFTQVDRDILGDVYQGYLPPDERKRLGEFYTPKEVIEYILDAVGYKPENEIRGKKLLDPACGSGGFLVEATQRLIKRYRRIGFNLRNPDDAKQIIDGCINSVYGLDIHPFACFIAEMNLLFQLVDLYCIAQQKDKYYKLPRIKIYQADSLMPPTIETVKLIEFFDNSRLRMLIEENKEANEIKKSKFDYVVGNPPYVRKERIPTDYKERVLTKTYPEVYHGDNDICVYFVIKGINWLNDGGKFGYIVSGKFTKARYGRKLREYITNTCCIEQFLDFRGVKIFREATNDPIILILNKEADIEKRDSQHIKVVNVKQEKETAKELIEYIKGKIKEKNWSDNYVDLFESKQSLLESLSWKLASVEVYTIFDKIQRVSNFLLKDVCEVYFGVKTGKNEVLVVNRETVDKFQLEKELLKPVLRGECVKRYAINYEGEFLIFPYGKEMVNGQLTYKVIDIEKYPNLFSYLTPYKNDLANRYDIKKSRSKWYELRPCDYYHVLESEKIITPDIAERNNFAYDEGKYYCLNTCYILAIKEDIRKQRKEVKEYLKFLLGLLNSSVLEFYFKNIATYLGKKGYRYFKGYLDELPIIEFSGEYPTNQISQLVDQILQLNDEIGFIRSKIKEFPDSYFENSWTFNKLANVIKAQSLSREFYAFSEKLLRTDYLLKDLDGRETFRIILAPNEYVDFYSEEIASYVFEVLKTMNGITKRELLELKIPTQQHLKNLMNQYRRDKQQIVKNEEAVKELEKQIDDLVYKLYDITYAERKIIEGYLEKF